MEYSLSGAHSGGLKNNRAFVSDCVHGTTCWHRRWKRCCTIRKTSGGLLISLPEDDAAKLQEAYPEAYIVGWVRESGRKPIEVMD